MGDDDGRSETGDPYDVAVVGGGPAGAAAATYLGRYGLETVVFDRGNSSLRRCAYLENYLGFPAGIDVPTLYDLVHAQIEDAGCELVADFVEAVTASSEGFTLETQDGTLVAAERVVAATAYDGEYLRGLDGEAMFTVHEHHDHTHEVFDREYSDVDGRTPVDGLFVAGGLAGAGEQVQLAAGHGVTVAREILADVRADEGYWESARPHYDWVRKRTAVEHDWDDEEAWHDRFAHHRLPEEEEEEEEDVDDERFERIRARELEFVRDSHLTEEEVERRRERGHQRLAAHLDTDAVVAALEDDLLDAVDDERLLDAVEDDALLDGDR